MRQHCCPPRHVGKINLNLGHILNSIPLNGINGALETERTKLKNAENNEGNESTQCKENKNRWSQQRSTDTNKERLSVEWGVYMSWFFNELYAHWGLSFREMRNYLTSPLQL